MLSTDPRTAISQLPFLLDVEPKDTLLLAAFDADGELRHQAHFPLTSRRPLDEPLLESSLWRDDVVFAGAIAYSSEPPVGLLPLIDAWIYRGRSPVVVAWAGPARWRSYLCDMEECCTTKTHTYSQRLAFHDDPDPLWDQSAPVAAWRRSRWEEWRTAIGTATSDDCIEPAILERLSRTLHDIPVRDAILAYSCDADTSVLGGLTTLLERITRRSVLGAAVPAYTCLAEMRYLAGDLTRASDAVRTILDAEEYSLARLLHNGLEMRAPASLLARSFSHFSPQDLLAA